MSEWVTDAETVLSVEITGLPGCLLALGNLDCILSGYTAFCSLGDAKTRRQNKVKILSSDIGTLLRSPQMSGKY